MTAEEKKVIKMEDGVSVSDLSQRMGVKTSEIIKKLMSGEVNNLSNGRTWRDGEDYNRPEIQDLFANPECPIMSDELGNLVGVSTTYAWNTPKVAFDKLPVVLDYIDRQLAA